ncbi:DNA replication protein DnaD/DnaB [[Clostridium] sordellii]|uniref:DnaD domain protein n=1 Tax=Paraclostridium sordellii TaxID=1505 RepID=UPI000541F86A|nr:DnaD domain protein [Paeniclostridium sordellii]CEK29399.1 DNA replication protein DnaD/DnaB [[Clostridium] sordellii] [Paeniclostridium sordellii]
MEYTIHGFSQENAIKLGLDDRDLLILRWFVRFKDNGKMASRIIDGDKYYWIKYEGVVEDLPITNIKSNDSVYRRLKKMAQVKVLKHRTIKEGGTYSYYCLGENYPSLVDTAKKLSDIYPNPSDLNPDGTDLNPEQKTLIPYPNNNISCMKKGLEEVLNYYKREIVNRYVLTKIEEDFFLKICDKIQYDLVIRAMEISIEANVKELRYIKGIIKKWLADDITTLEKLEGHKLKYDKTCPSKNSINKNNKNIHGLKTRYHNINQSFSKYDGDELEKMLLENQKGKFK